MKSVGLIVLGVVLGYALFVGIGSVFDWLDPFGGGLRSEIERIREDNRELRAGLSASSRALKRAVTATEQDAERIGELEESNSHLREINSHLEGLLSATYSGAQELSGTIASAREKARKAGQIVSEIRAEH